jgi:chemotaxis protein MotB
MARKKEHAHADERWLLTYADMITLLMALFMVLFSIAVVNKGKFDELARSLREAFAGPLDRGGNSILDVGTDNPTADAPSEVQAMPQPIQPGQTQTPTTAQQAAANQAALQRAKALDTAQQQNLAAAKVLIDRRVSELGFEKQVSTTIDSRGLVIRLITDKVLFDVGSSTIRPEAYPLLSVVTGAVEKLASNPVRVNGYTDAIPYVHDPYGNERLSTDRSLAVFIYMLEHGFSLKRHPDAGSGGFGDRDPIVPNDPGTGAGPRNRRVEVVVQWINYEQATKAQIGGALGLNPAAVPDLGPGAVKITP